MPIKIWWRETGCSAIGGFCLYCFLFLKKTLRIVHVEGSIQKLAFHCWAIKYTLEGKIRLTILQINTIFFLHMCKIEQNRSSSELIFLKWPERQGSANILGKGPDSKYSMLSGPTVLCDNYSTLPSWWKSSLDNAYKNVCDCVPIKLYLQNEYIRPMACSLLILK